MKNLINWIQNKTKITLKMETQNKIVYMYTAEDLKQNLIDTLKLSISQVLDKNSNSKKNNYIMTHYKRFENGNYTESANILWNPINQINSMTERFLKTFASSSKKTKKKINKALYILSRNSGSQQALIKLLNLFEKKGENLTFYSISNSKEREIQNLRKEYKTLVKYIKMDLPSELKKAKEAYKESKGNFYK